MGKTRPETECPAEIYYDETESVKYTQNSRIIEIQRQCSVRCMELLNLDPLKPSMILDLGCGSGLSGEVITEEGHSWVGIDISQSMLNVAMDREQEEPPNLLMGDMGQVLPFRPAMFDGCISVSALQWLCHAFKKSHNPRARLAVLFKSLFACLSRGSRAVFQFYPENESQVSLIVTEATKAGFSGGVVVDFPNSAKAKKYYLTLMCGGREPLPEGLDEVEEQNQAAFTKRQRERNVGLKKLSKNMSTLERIEKFKNKRKRQGKQTSENSKYSGRRRAGKFW